MKAMTAVFIFSASIHEFIILGRVIYVDNCIALIHGIFILVPKFLTFEEAEGECFQDQTVTI